jgi:hypothetical protein
MMACDNVYVITSSAPTTSDFSLEIRGAERSVCFDVSGTVDVAAAQLLLDACGNLLGPGT